MIVFPEEGAADLKAITQRMRLAALAVDLSGVEFAMSCLAGSPPITTRYFAGLSGAVTIAAAVARLTSQKSLPKSSE